MTKTITASTAKKSATAAIVAKAASKSAAASAPVAAPAIQTLTTKDGAVVPKLATYNGHRFGRVWMGEARNKGKLVTIERTFEKLQATATQLGVKFTDKTPQDVLATKVSEKLQAFQA